MTGNEVAERIRAQRTTAHCCVKSWGADHKLVDFELIEPFMKKLRGEDAFEGFELLDLEQLWEALAELDPDKLTREKTAAGEAISWVWTDQSGKEIKTTFPFSPEGIMTIMNDEFFS